MGVDDIIIIIYIYTGDGSRMGEDIYYYDVDVDVEKDLEKLAQEVGENCSPARRTKRRPTWTSWGLRQLQPIRARKPMWKENHDDEQWVMMMKKI